MSQDVAMGSIEQKIDFSSANDEFINSVVTVVHQLVEQQMNSRGTQQRQNIFNEDSSEQITRQRQQPPWERFHEKCRDIWDTCIRTCSWESPCRGRLIFDASEEPHTHQLEILANNVAFNDILFPEHSEDPARDLMKMAIVPCCKFTLVSGEICNDSWEKQRVYAPRDRTWMRCANDCFAFRRIRDMALNNIENFAPRIMDVVNVKTVDRENRGLFAAHNILAGSAVMCWKTAKLQDRVSGAFEKNYSFQTAVTPKKWAVPPNIPADTLLVSSSELTDEDEQKWVKSGVAQLANNECNPTLIPVTKQSISIADFLNPPPDNTPPDNTYLPSSILFQTLLKIYDFRADSMFHWLWRENNEFAPVQRLQTILQFANCISDQIDLIASYKDTLLDIEEEVQGFSKIKDRYGFLPLQCLCAPPNAQLSYTALTAEFNGALWTHNLKGYELDGMKYGVMKSSNAWLTEVDIDVALAWWAHNSNAFHFRTLRNYNTNPTTAQSSFLKCLIASTSAVSELHKSGSSANDLTDSASENVDAIIERLKTYQTLLNSVHQLPPQPSQLHKMMGDKLKYFGTLTKILSGFTTENAKKKRTKNDDIFTLPLYFCATSDNLSAHLKKLFLEDNDKLFVDTVMKFVSRNALTPFPGTHKNKIAWSTYCLYVEGTNEYLTALIKYVQSTSLSLQNLQAFVIHFVRGINAFANAKTKFWLQFMFETQPVADDVWAAVTKNRWTVRHDSREIQQYCRNQRILQKDVSARTTYDEAEKTFRFYEGSTSSVPIGHYAYKIPERLLVGTYDKLLIPLNNGSHWWLGEYVLNGHDDETSAFGQFCVYNSLSQAEQSKGWLEIHGLILAQAHFELHFCKPDPIQTNKLQKLLQQEIKNPIAHQPFKQGDGNMCGIMTIMTAMALTMNPAKHRKKGNELSQHQNSEATIRQIVLTSVVQNEDTHTVNQPVLIHAGSAVEVFMRTWIALVQIYGTATPTQNNDYDALVSEQLLATSNRVARYGTGNLLRMPLEQKPWAVFFASQNIRKGEELLYTYNAASEHNDIKEFNCNCRFCTSSPEVFYSWCASLRSNLIQNDWIPEQAKDVQCIRDASWLPSEEKRKSVEASISTANVSWDQKVQEADSKLSKLRPGNVSETRQREADSNLHPGIPGNHSDNPVIL
jgi:hypothetical protein